MNTKTVESHCLNTSVFMFPGGLYLWKVDVTHLETTGGEKDKATSMGKHLEMLD